MASLEELEARVRALEDIEAIRALKARYWRFVDGKRWDDLADCFTDDVVLEVEPTASYPAMRVEGRGKLIRHLEKTLGSAITVHQGHNAEIEITGSDTARGIWPLYDRIPDMAFEGWGHYEEEYLREGGRWWIKRTRLTRLSTGSPPREG